MSRELRQSGMPHMAARMKLGDYLVAHLRTIGVTHLFGIPGDLVINLFVKFDRPRGLRIVTFSHEPGFGFAADGYARATGSIGVVCVTYGAGGHNMVNPVAGSFSERVPVLVISGGTGEEERKLGTLIHHQAKEIESQFRIYKELTCAARVIDDTHRAAAHIDEVVQTVRREQGPGYLEIHRDMVEREIDVPLEIRERDRRLVFAHSDRRKVTEAARDTVRCFNAARRPSVIVGIETYRFKCTSEVVKLVERLGAPCMTTVLAKGAIPADHPLHMGVHIGPLSPPAIRRRVDESDLVLNLGTLLTDMNLGSRPPRITREKSIWAVQNRVNVSFHTYTDVGIRDYVRALLRMNFRHHEEEGAILRQSPEETPGSDQANQGDGRPLGAEPLSSGRAGIRCCRRIGGHALRRTRRSGDAPRRLLSSGLLRFHGLRRSRSTRPAARHGRAPDRALWRRRLPDDRQRDLPRAQARSRPDRAHTQQRWLGYLSTGSPREDLLATPPWPYAELARAWGGFGIRVERVGELREALREADKAPSFAVIEILIGPHDLSLVTIKHIRSAAKKGRATA